MRRREFLLAGLAPFTGLARSLPDCGLSCILLRLTGGPSHLDTWDPKPDAPAEIRGPFRAISTNVPGMRISELFPRMARCADKYALIRSVYSDSPARHEAPLRRMPRMDKGIGERDAERYGATEFGRRCLQAVRLLEDGERHSIAIDMFGSVFDGVSWDMHGWGPFSTMRDYRDVIAPMFDMAYSAMLEDLSQRGLLEKTLIVSAGEFGRSPRINPSGGRDHWPHCRTIAIAGGGVRGGQIYGSSDGTGSYPRDHPVKLACATSDLSALFLEPAGSCADKSPFDRERLPLVD